MSQTSAEMNANTNPPEYVISIHINKEYLMPEDEAFLNGWEKWSLEDIIPIFNSANWRFRLAASGYFGEIVFLKLLEARITQISLSNWLKKLYILFSIRVWTTRVWIFSNQPDSSMATK